MDFNAKVVRAIRPRICSACKRTINARDRYVRVVRMDIHGVFIVQKLCLYHGADPDNEMTDAELAEVLYGQPGQIPEVPFDGESPVPLPTTAADYNEYDNLKRQAHELEPDPDTGSFPRNPFEDTMGPQ